MKAKELMPAVSKAELKRMVAREHNRAYNAGELEPKDDVAGFLQHVTRGFANALQETPKK